MRNLIIITLVLSCSAIFVGIIGCTTGVTDTGGTGIARYLGAAVCKECHSSAYNDYVNTAHFDTMVDDPDNPYDFYSIWEADGKPEYCLPCHTTGWDETKNNGGADEAENYENLLGIQCESCHGPGSLHVEGGGDKTQITVTYGAELCGSCHNGEHHPTYDEWEESIHAYALEGLKSSSHAGDHCLVCHSADYIYDRTVTIDTAQEGLTCVACHKAHGSFNDHQLLLPGEEICISCHTMGDAQPGSTPHHASYEMLMGFGGYEWPGEPYSNSPHTTMIPERCVRCHMWTEGMIEENPAVMGHTFEPNINVCQECHPSATDFNINGAQTEIEGLLEDLSAELEAGTEEDTYYDEASFDYNFVNNDGGSKGVHNYDYAKKLLEDSILYYEPGTK
jgi:predicted CXXCH cytochrome family protein